MSMDAAARKALATIRQCVEAGRYRVSRHFEQRLDERGLFWFDALAVLANPSDVQRHGATMSRQARRTEGRTENAPSGCSWLAASVVVWRKHALGDMAFAGESPGVVKGQQGLLHPQLLGPQICQGSGASLVSVFGFCSIAVLYVPARSANLPALDNWGRPV